MENKLYTKSEVIDFINAGRVMLLSGSEKALEGLPKGNWIAGTTPYFMDTVGKVSEDKIFVDDFTLIAKDSKLEIFDKNNIKDIAKKGFANGFIVTTMPIDSEVLAEFANHSLEYDDIYNNPLVGFVSCCLFDDFGKVKTYSGTGIDGKLYNDKAVALYVELPEYLAARCEIMNFDTIDENTSKVVFPKTSFVQSDCLIDGKPGNISDYFENVVKAKLGRYTQMITSQNGALINRDPRVVNTETGETSFFSPVYAGDEYYLVKNGSDYFKMFNDTLKAKKSDVVSCLSCISYYFGGNFEGRSICKNGVYAFGEIAYQLLNKTIVTLEIDNIG
ncbi:MAG: hypothetical protein MJZ61_00040 [Bacteroidales bacterium]|nr:hypothetical protein [Bacteroidales bacterium]